MEAESQSLDKKIEKYDRKQWLPFVGAIIATYDLFKGRPSIIDMDDEFTPYVPYTAWQAVSTLGVAGLIYGVAPKVQELYHVVEKLF